MEISKFNNSLMYSNKNLEKLIRKVINESSNAVLLETFTDKCILQDHITGGIYSCDYDEFKSYCSKEFGGIKYYNKILHEYVKLVRDFDKLSDKIYDYLNEVINKM